MLQEGNSLLRTKKYPALRVTRGQGLSMVNDENGLREACSFPAPECRRRRRRNSARTGPSVVCVQTNRRDSNHIHSPSSFAGASIPPRHLYSRCARCGHRVLREKAGSQGLRPPDEV
ncbi:hypothetical protein EVA_10365 [gut metagenome]|uniref:Uncharacterized protein n=1 Tax=gut metagenome TaxID=749906 RepID=J9GI05_9ZZZZ